jgi:UDPglucose 6-dehydrogenase
VSVPVIGIAGLTHLGLVSATALAAKGFSVLGVDSDSQRVQSIDAARLPVVEPGLDELFVSNRPRMKFSEQLSALESCDVVYIAQDVPTDGRGVSDLSAIRRLIDGVIPALKPGSLLVVLCQVPPGFTRALPLAPERLYYQVETLVFGRAVERALQPERFIVGCADPARSLAVQYQEVLKPFGCPILPMRYESAELAKISINCCLVASVTVANTLADLCERLGADWSEILPALKLDRRIGAYSYLTPGLGIAGGNLERDLATVLRLAQGTGSEASLIEAFVRNSRYRRDWALRVLHRELLDQHREATLGILGLAYKENTNSTKNSPSLALIEHLGPWPLRVYDPVVPASVLSHPTVSVASSALDAAKGVDALLIMTPWPQFRALNLAQIAAAMAGHLLIDPYRVFEPGAAAVAGLSHRTLGWSQENA